MPVTAILLDPNGIQVAIVAIPSVYHEMIMCRYQQLEPWFNLTTEHYEWIEPEKVAYKLIAVDGNRAFYQILEAHKAVQ